MTNGIDADEVLHLCKGFFSTLCKWVEELDKPARRATPYARSFWRVTLASPTEDVALELLAVALEWDDADAVKSLKDLRAGLLGPDQAYAHRKKDREAARVRYIQPVVDAVKSLQARAEGEVERKNLARDEQPQPVAAGGANACPQAGFVPHRDDRVILRALGASKVTMTQETLSMAEKNGGTGLSARNILKRLANLRERGYTHRPNGDRGGEAITDKGRSLIAP